MFKEKFVSKDYANEYAYTHGILQSVKACPVNIH